MAVVKLASNREERWKSFILVKTVCRLAAAIDVANRRIGSFKEDSRIADGDIHLKSEPRHILLEIGFTHDQTEEPSRH